MTQLQILENQENIIVSLAMTQFEISDLTQSILTKVDWTQHLTIISRTKSDEEREFYMRLCIKEHYSVKELETQINSAVFERVMIGNTKLSAVLREIHPDKDNNL